VDESVPGFVQTVRAFETIVEVIENGTAPLNTASRRADQTDTPPPSVPIALVFRRPYTYTVTAALTATANQFQVAAQGQVLYRTTLIDSAPTLGAAIVAVQTVVPLGGAVQDVSVNPVDSVGMPALYNLKFSSSECSTIGDTCSQVHTTNFPSNPCKVNANLTLFANLVCSNESAKSTSCGYVGIQLNTLYQLKSVVVNYDSCAVITTLGVNTSLSYLRLYVEPARLVLVSQPQAQGSTLYGKLALFPSKGSQFANVTLTRLALFQQSASGVTNLGESLAAPWLKLISPYFSTSQSPVWLFNVWLDPKVFRIQDVYYFEATTNIQYRNTGGLTRVIRMELTRDVTSGLFSNTYRVVAATLAAVATAGGGGGSTTVAGGGGSTTSAESSTESEGLTSAPGAVTGGVSSGSLVWIIYLGAGVCFAALLASCFLLVAARRRRRDICAYCEMRKRNMPNVCPCRDAWYCQDECQLKHWPEHRIACKNRRKICLYCGTPGARKSMPNVCPCNEAWYCGDECQLQHWSEHRPVCKQVSNAGFAQAALTPAQPAPHSADSLVSQPFAHDVELL
jgi:hypothetical protein